MATGKHGRKSVPILPPFGDRRRQRIGILGGSFNPAHAGHLHISREALRRLNLDQVWWLVSPQNPLKSKRNMASLRHRMIAAKFVAKDSRILVTDLEQRLGSTRTAITLQHLCARYPNIQFIWLMGADNLSEVPRWWRWTGVFSAVRVAIFDRSPYSFPALAGQAASRFARFRARRPSSIWLRSPPHWTYIATCRHPASATTLRAIDHSGRPTE